MPSAIKKTLHASEQTRPDVAEARERWKAGQASLDPTKLVFIDETGTNTKMVRTRRDLAATDDYVTSRRGGRSRIDRSRSQA